VKRLAVLTFAFVIACTAAGCRNTETPRLELTGSVVDSLTVIAVPVAPLIEPDLEAGVRESTATAAAPGVDPGGTSPTSTRAIRWAKVASVSVRPGDQVTPGQELARVDDTLLQLAVKAAQAKAAMARADITLLDDRLAEVTEGRSELSTKAADLDDSIADLEADRADVANQLATARGALSASTSATETAQLAPRVAALETALATLESGLEQARTGRSQLASATADLDTARTAIGGLQAAAKAALEARDISVQIAQQQLADAIIYAPIAGIVVDAPLPGDVLASGAPLVRLRVSSATRVETYVTADVARRIAPGTQAMVYIDALPGRGQPARVVHVGDRLEFVPTTFATEIIHLSRALRVVIELDGTRWIAPGSPADVEISVK
jgi:HlyD family secretion protein